MLRLSGVLVAVLCIARLLEANQQICDELNPCDDRGVCDSLPGVSSKDILSVRCDCRDHLTGQWCQFLGDYYLPGEKAPGKPSIITNTKERNYELKYELKFQGVKDPAEGKVLYYHLRYADITKSQKEWRSKSIAVNKDSSSIHTIVLDTLDWGHRYKLELYAGNRFGVGDPDKRTLTRPTVAHPLILMTSENKIGSKAVRCCKTPVRLTCNAIGTPAPSYSWTMNGEAMQTHDSTLVIDKPSGSRPETDYRCLASNAWGAVVSRPILVDIIDQDASIPPEDPGKVERTRIIHVRSLEVAVYQASFVTLKCQTSGLTAIESHWFYNAIPIDDSKGKLATISKTYVKYKLAKGVLELIEVKQTASGVYQCDVTTKKGIVGMRHYVHVRDYDHIEPLRLRVKTSDQVRLKEGGAAILTCSPKLSKLLITRWRNIPKKNKRNYKKLADGSLEIRKVRKSDSNTKLTCESTSYDTHISIKRFIYLHVYRPVDGAWSAWGAWGQCPSGDCDEISRTRKCLNPAPKNGGKFCRGLDLETIGVWAHWSSWRCVPKSGKCGKHHKIRTRKCKSKTERCLGKKKMTRACSTFTPCPVDGGWSKWSKYSPCSKTCFPGGTMFRERKCDSPAPKHGGKPCKGKSKKTRKCKINSKPCPIHGGWSTWSSWSSCSMTCFDGVMSRERNCTNPVPQYGGRDCVGKGIMTEKCTNAPCKGPVDGGWSAWSSFTACSVTCGSGLMYSHRMCNNPRPAQGGKDCEGNSQYRTQCDMLPCTVNGVWTAWSSWSGCSTTCNDGVRTRVRNCTNPASQHHGLKCEGKDKEELICKNPRCKGHGGWSSWGKWSPCSVKCGSGLKTRTRSCSRGRKCRGTHQSKAKCHQKSCREFKNGEEDGLSDVKIVKEEDSASSVNNVIMSAVGGSVAIVFLVIFFCWCRRSRKRSGTKDYMPLTTVKTDPIVTKSILKNKRESTALADGKSTKPTNMTSGNSNARKDPRRGSKPSKVPPPPPVKDKTAVDQTPQGKRPTRKSMRKPAASSSVKVENTKDASSHKIKKDSGSQVPPVAPPIPKDPTTSSGNKIAVKAAKSESGKEKDGDGHKITKDSRSPKAPQASSVPLAISKGPTTVSSEKVASEKSTLGSKVKDAGEHKITKDSGSSKGLEKPFGSTSIPKVPTSGDGKDGLAKEVETKDVQGQKAPSSLSISERSSDSSSAPPCPSMESTKSGKIMESESCVYGNLIGFENAILESGDDTVAVRKAKIHKIRSKSKQTKTSD